MEFTEACLKETLRKYSVVPVVTRVARNDTQLCGRDIPAGSRIVLHFQGTHELWKDPTVYRPDRFLPGGEFDLFSEDIRRCACMLNCICDNLSTLVQRWCALQASSPLGRSCGMCNLNVTASRGERWHERDKLAHKHAQHNHVGKRRLVHGAPSSLNGSMLRAERSYAHAGSCSCRLVRARVCASGNTFR